MVRGSVGPPWPTEITGWLTFHRANAVRLLPRAALITAAGEATRQHTDKTKLSVEAGACYSDS